MALRILFRAYYATTKIKAFWEVERGKSNVIEFIMGGSAIAWFWLQLLI